MLKDLRREGGIRDDERTRDPLAALVHPSLLTTSPTEQLRGKVLVVTGILILLLVTPLTIFHLLYGSPTVTILCLFLGGMGVATSLSIKLRGSVFLAGNLLCLALWVALAAGLLDAGYFHAYGSRWLVLIPVFATLFGGVRMGAAWFAMSVALMFGLGLGLPSQPPHNTSTDYDNVPYHLVSLTIHMILVVGMIGAAEWVRERTFKKLEKEKQRTQSIMDRFSDGIAALNSSCELIDANPIASRLFDEFGQDTIMALAREMKGDESCGRSLWSRGEVYLDIECVCLHPDIEPDDLDPTDAMWLMVIRDVTAARLDALTLERAMEATSRASEAKTQFVVMLSHELRTPLNAVVGYAELIMDSAGDGDMEATLDDARSLQLASEHLNSLVSSTLDLAKIESGKLLLDISDVPIEALLREVTRSLKPTFQARGNTLELALSSTITRATTFETDNLKLRQILINLLNNAAKHTENARVQVRAWSEASSITIEVMDEGEGMSEQTLARIWEEFVQADETTLSQNGGTGLGLALVKRLTHLLGGSIDVSSALGIGTTFTLVFPDVFTPIVEDAPRNSWPSISSERANSLAGEASSTGTLSS